MIKYKIDYKFTVLYFRRFVQSEELWLKIRAAALGLGPELKLGGNGPVIAKRMVEEGAEVLLAIQNEKVGQVSQTLELNLPRQPNIRGAVMIIGNIWDARGHFDRAHKNVTVFNWSLIRAR